MALVELCPADIADGEFRVVERGEARLCVVNNGGSHFVMSDRCPHEECYFSEFGVLEDDVLECTCHGSQFDPGTGEVIVGPAWDSVVIVPVSVLDGALTVETERLDSLVSQQPSSDEVDSA